jgi:outer membrane protein assembly factor BamB
MVAAEGLVFVCGRDWTLYAFDAKTGEEKWTWNGGNTEKSLGNILVRDGKVFVSKGTSCYCLDRGSGKELWNSGGKSTRTYLTEENGILYCASGPALWALDAATGKERWMFKTGSMATAPPALTKDTVFSTTFDGWLYAVAIEPEPEEPKK